VTGAPLGRSAYERAGVDVAAGDRAVELLRQSLGAGDPDLLGGLHGFAAAVEIPTGYSHPVLVTATDGVGTKTEIARLLGRYDTIGRDLVAMCADDVVCHGARPAFFLDYLALGQVVPDRVAEIVGGVAAACAEIGARVIGGETAEHPGLMKPDEFDLAGFCIGFVERDELIDGTSARPGDVVVGMASSGLHANGYSLVRALLADGRLELTEALLEPTRLYAADSLALLDDARHAGWRIGGLAHITGGGLPGNLPRAVPAALAIEVDPAAWPVPPIIAEVARAAGLDGSETRATFNAGVGMAAVIEPAAAERALGLLGARGLEAWPIGRVVEAASGGPRYIERE
jgi:phosphoribosylformylglycinamidine cyclo-ligase